MLIIIVNSYINSMDDKSVADLQLARKLYTYTQHAAS